MTQNGRAGARWSCSSVRSENADACRGCFQRKAGELVQSLANVGVRRLHAVLLLLSSAICSSRQHPSILLCARLPTFTRPRTLSARREFSCARSRAKKKKQPQIPHIWWTGVREMSRTGVGGLAARPLRPLSCATEQGGRARLKPQQSAKRSSANREECVTVCFPRRATRKATAAQSRSDRNSGTILFFVTHCRRLSNAVTATNVSDPRSLSAGDLPCQLCPLEEIHSDQQRVSVINQAALLLLFPCFNLELLGKVDGAP